MHAKSVIYGYYSVAVLQLVDFASTFVGITFLGMVEGNPVSSMVLSEIGWLGVLAFKLALALVFAWWARHWDGKAPGVNAVVAGGLLALYALVVTWNLFLIAVKIGLVG